MSSIPIFDSLMHPMPNGCWMSSHTAGTNRIQDQLDFMRRYDIRWGLAVGLGSTIGGYNEETYAGFVRHYTDQLFPVAYCDFSRLAWKTDVEPYVLRLKTLGYIAIKIHPRIAGVNYDHPLLHEVILAANRIGLGVLLCTYFWSHCGGHDSSGLEGLMTLLTRVPDQKLILLHGGAVRLLEVAEIVRHFPSVLLDLSFTLCKYEGSSLDFDIRYLFNKFDRRICIGSDSPEFGHHELRRRFEEFSKGLESIKASNIAYKNLLEHLNIDATD